MQLIEKNSKFIFRLKEDYYKKERERMKSDDEYVDINLNSARTSNIKNQDIKRKSKAKRSSEFKNCKRRN